MDLYLVVLATFLVALALSFVVVNLVARAPGRVPAEKPQEGRLPVLMAQGRLSEALELATNQGDFRTAAKVLLKMQQPQRAAEYFVRVGDLEAAALAYLRVPDLRRAAECYAKNRQYEKAAEVYVQVGDMWAAADALVAAGRLDQAAKVHRQLGNEIQAARLEAEALVKAGRYAEAGNRLVEIGDFQKAAEYLAKAGLVREAARAYRQASRPDMAAALLEKAGAYGEAAALYEEAGDHAAAARLYQRVQDPLKEVEALVAAGDILAAGQLAYKLGDRGRAEGILKMATPADRGFVRVCLLLGRILEEAGRLDEAARYYAIYMDRAIPTEKTANVFRLLARFLEDRGAKEAALRALRKLDQAALLGQDGRVALERLEKAVGTGAEPPKSISSMLSFRREAVPEVLADRYQIVRRLGEGGTAVVYLAQDKKLKREVVLKFLSNPSLPGDLAEDYFMREAEIVANMSHPHIVKVFDIGRADGRPFMVMEYLEGSTLDAFLEKNQRQGLPMTTIARMATEIADALAYAHARQVIHRDIKPGNIMLLPDGHAKLMDFGMAKALAVDRSRSLYICGTPDYMSPEQEAGLDLTKATDVYSFGLVLLEAMLGSIPTAPSARAARLARLEALESSKIPEPVKRTIASCLSLDPKERPQDPRSIAAVLARAANQTAGA